MGLSSGTSTRWLFVHCFQIELEFGVLVFVEGGKPENPEKNPRSKDENQQQTQPTCDARSGNRTRATAVGGEHSHHCAIPAPLLSLLSYDYYFFCSCRQSTQLIKAKKTPQSLRSLPHHLTIF